MNIKNTIYAGIIFSGCATMSIHRKDYDKKYEYEIKNLCISFRYENYESNGKIPFIGDLEYRICDKDQDGFVDEINKTTYFLGNALSATTIYLDEDGDIKSVDDNYYGPKKGCFIFSFENVDCKLEGNILKIANEIKNEVLGRYKYEFNKSKPKNKNIVEKMSIMRLSSK